MLSGMSLLCLKNKNWACLARTMTEKGRRGFREKDRGQKKLIVASHDKECRCYSEHKKPYEDSDSQNMGCILYLEPTVCLKNWCEGKRKFKGNFKFLV